MHEKMNIQTSPVSSFLLSAVVAFCGNLISGIEARAQVAEEIRQQGNDLANDGDCLAASRLYTKAIEMDPELSRAYFNRANCIVYSLPNISHCIGPKDLAAALADFDKAIELEPSNTEYLTYRANCLSDMKMYDEAIADFTRAIAIDPAWPTYFSRARTKLEMGDREGACADYEMMPDSGNPEVQSSVELAKQVSCPK